MTAPNGAPPGGGGPLARLERLAEGLAAAALLAAAAIVAASVLGRAVFGAGVPDDVVLTGLLTVAVAALPLAAVQARGGHIAVDVAARRLPPPLRRAVRRAGLVLGAAVFGAIGVLVAAALPQAVAEGHHHAGVLRLPAWPMRALFAAALLLFAARLLLSLRRGA